MRAVPARPYAFDLEPPKAALLVIDMQRDFLEPGGFGAALGNDVSLLRQTIAPTTRVVAAALFVEMMVISFGVLYPSWSWGKRGMEYALFMGLISLAILLRGGGRYSLDRLIGREF